MTMTAPARYDELPYPVGTFTDIFERQAINMCVCVSSDGQAETISGR